MPAVEPDGNWPEDNGAVTTGHLLRRWGRVGGIAAALGMSVVFAAAAWYALQRSDMQPSVVAEVPLIMAQPGAMKEKPDDPGGLKIPNQDKLVFERITPKAQAPIAEIMAPAPEEPIVEMAAPASPALMNGLNSVNPQAGMAKTAQPATIRMLAKALESKDKNIAAIEKHAVSPTISAKTDAAMAPKVESLLPTLPTSSAAAKTVPIPVANSPAIAPVVALLKLSDVKASVAQIVTGNATKSGYRIQMGAYRKADLADLAWNRLRKAHSDLLAGLTGHTESVDLGKRGTLYRVQAGFYQNMADARSACGKLKAKKQDCIIVPPQ